ncbi:MAG TPA: GNAT family N-acetyltransferase [Acidimicrobiia bacterium]|jgi:acetyl coenzyme A synthetase (ADP forming)-like protein|nr:GNAT family N-acetyltransferase [Acidimicrobiia bacterium]
MATYPAQWESDVVLSDGGTVRFRPVRAGDEDRILSLYEHLSDESIYLRFFSPVPRPTAAQLERITNVDYVNTMAMVAELSDEFVAIARYDRVGPAEAEVAFTVRDDQQGRGLGTLLLEHLAVAARANGFTEFSATTLPHNARMLNVFADAGWVAEREFVDGAIRVRFSIEPTADSVAAVDARESQAEAASIVRLLSPQSIAVVGASRAPGTIGHEVFRNLLQYGFQGPVYPVNPTAGSVAGVRAYATVLDVPDAVDLAVIVVPAKHVPEVVEQCARKHVLGLVVISAGFAETGADGKAQQREIVAMARRNGMRMIGPNCLGVVNTAPHVRMNATFAPVVPVPGHVGFLSQSGGLGIELMARAGALGIGISEFVSVGNKADVSGNDLLQHWETDPNTSVILFYLESFGNPRKFARLARRIAQRKPIVAVKSGRTLAGSRAASSHTAALASPDVAVDALFRQAGVIRVDTLEELLDTAQVLSSQPLPAGRRVAIVSNAGGPGILAADACSGAGLEVSELADPTQRALRAFVAADASVRNPIDLVAGATADDFERALHVVLADDAIDAVLAIFVPPLVTRAEDVARAIAAAAARAAAGKPVIACFLGRDGVPDELRGDESHRTVPSFAFPEAAARALGRAADLADWRRQPIGIEPAFDDIDVQGARAIVREQLVRAPEGAWLDVNQAGDLLSRFGINVAASRLVADADGAARAADELGYPVVLKAGSPAIVHKTDVGGVALGLANAEAVRDAYATMAARLGDDMGGAIVQATVAPGVETIVGVTQDPSFGPLVLFGLGGVTAELLADRALRIVPLTDEDAKRLVRSLRGSPLLFGYRGRPSVDVTALEALLLRVGRLADELPEITEMDLNPVVVSEGGAVAVDIKMRCAPAAGATPRDLRRMRVDITGPVPALSEQDGTLHGG